MKKNLLALSLALLMALGVSAQADVMNSKAKPFHALKKGKITHRTPQVKSPSALLFEENFDYPAGDLLTAHGWTVQSGTTNFIATTPASLTYPNYLSSGIGNEVSLVATGEDVFKAFAPQTAAGSVYVSFIANITTAANTGDYFFNLRSDVIGNTDYRGRIYAKTDGTNALAFGISFAGLSAPAVPVYTPYNYTLGTIYLIVLKYTIVDGTSNDIVSMFIDPVMEAVEPTATAVAVDINTDLSNIGAVSLRQGTAANAVTLKLDGIRVGTAWADVVGSVPVASIPLTEDFEGDFPASGWSLTAGSGDWAQAADVNHTTGGANSAIYDCYSINGVVPAYLQTPEMAVTTGDATFSFWCDYYLVDPAGTDHGANLFVDISTDGGTTWTDGTLDYLAGITLDTWTPFSIDLTSNIGQNVVLRFKGISDWGYYNIAIDDVAGPALNLAAHDLGVTAITPDNGFVLTGSTVTPHVFVANFGASDEATYTVQLTDGLSYNETINATATLASLGSIDITFPAWTPADGNYTLTATVTVADDANADNNIATVPVAVRGYLWGDIISQFTTQTGGATGVETDGTNIYVQHWNNAIFDRYDMNGVFLNTFTIAAAANIRDLAYDGTNFYGAPGNTSVFKLDFTPGSEALVSTIIAPQSIRALTYDSDDNTFWGNNGIGMMKEFGMTGTLTGRSFTPSVSIYGAAYDNFSNPASPTIWGNQWAPGIARLVEWNLDGTTTGRVIDLTSQLSGAAAGAGAGGLAIYKEGNTAYLLADFQTSPENTVVKVFLATTAGADVTFNVTDGVNPIANANVNVNGNDYATSATGSVTITLAPETYAYTVSKPGFNNETGNITVVDGVNQTIDVAMSVVVEDFEGVFPPSGWSLTAGSGNWAKMSDVNHTTGGANSATYDCYNIDGIVPAYLQTYEMAVTAGDATFSFWCNYYLVSGAWGNASSLFVDISTDGGATWTAGTTNYLSGITFDTWTSYSIDLTANIGQNVVMRFKAISDFGSYNIAIDDVSGPVRFLSSHDMGVTAVTPSGTVGVLPIIPVVSIINNGSLDEATYTVLLSDGVSYSETYTSIVPLVSLGSIDISFPAWTHAAGAYTLTATVTVAGDVNASNDVVVVTGTAVDGLLWYANIDNTASTNGIVSTDLGGLANGLIETADDFILPAGTWTIDQITTTGFVTVGTLTGFQVIIYNDNAGVPGTVFFEEVVAETNAAAQTLTFTTPLVLTGGNTYWLMVAGIYPTATALTQGRWNWFTFNKLTGNEASLRDNPGLFGVGTAWQTLSALGVTGAGSTNFAVYGHVYTASTATDILTFDFNGLSPAVVGTVDPVNHTVVATVPFGTDVTALVPAITLSAGATVAPLSGVANDFTNAVVYTVTAQDGVTTQDWTITVTISTGIDAIGSNGISVYPNPSNGVFNVMVNEAYKMQVVDLTGKVISARILTGNSIFSIENAGVYFLKFSNENHNYVQRIIVR